MLKQLIQKWKDFEQSIHDVEQELTFYDFMSWLEEQEEEPLLQAIFKHEVAKKKCELSQEQNEQDIKCYEKEIEVKKMIDTLRDNGIYTTHDAVKGVKEYLDKPKSIYNLQEGDEYWYIMPVHNIVDKEVWDGEDESDLRFLEIGNVFLTKEEATNELKKRKAVQRVKKWIHENDIQEYKYRIAFIDGDFVPKKVFGEKYFYPFQLMSFEDAERCIKELGDSCLKIIFGI